MASKTCSDSSRVSSGHETISHISNILIDPWTTNLQLVLIRNQASASTSLTHQIQYSGEIISKPSLSAWSDIIGLLGILLGDVASLLATGREQGTPTVSSTDHFCKVPFQPNYAPISYHYHVGPPPEFSPLSSSPVIALLLEVVWDFPF